MPFRLPCPARQVQGTSSRPGGTSALTFSTESREGAESSLVEGEMVERGRGGWFCSSVLRA
jgi:hypothetical protein